jgi:hypothetical protein
VSDGAQNQALNDCGCCEGLTVETPVALNNRPGLSAIAYRTGTQTQFKASMIARLSESGLAELRNLKTRDDDDFTIALLDSWAVVCDVLTFYQERIANESYLLTATERSSIINLARLIGYELRPGVAASTFLAFTLETGPGAPEAVTVGKGTRVQSIPGPGEKPQSFESTEEVVTRAEWQDMRPRLTELQLPRFGSNKIYLQGVTTNLKPGDILLFVGQEREEKVDSERWDVRRVSTIETDAENQRTFVRWAEPLGSVVPRVDPAQKDVKVFAMRLRASLFGYNAPQWKALPVALRVGEMNPEPPPSPIGSYKAFLPGVYATKENEWADAPLPAIREGNTTSINLDSVYTAIVLNSWIVLTRPKTKAQVADAELYRVRFVGEESKADYNITAKTTLLEISGEHIENYSPRNASVHAHSDEQQIAETPITDPLWKDEIVLDRLITPLEAGRTIVVTGRRMRARIEPMRTKFALTSESDPPVSKKLETGDELVLMSLPTATAPDSATMRFQLMDESGFVGFVEAPVSKVTLIPADENDAVVSEMATIKSTESADDTHSKLVLSASLSNVFDRDTVKINANVALGTHGETVLNEVLGSGDAAQPYQRFALRQAPLTYVSADTPSGGLTTLEVRVNDLKWKEVPTLFGHGPRERIYITHTDDDQKTTVQFGDGVTGARLPMGRENVTATYRKGIGLGGLVKASQLSLLMTRPLGVKGVINPLAATGAQDPQALADARANSPLTVLTLDRIVSLRDYEDFARSFSGIAKALVTWTWNVHARGVFVTVAGIDGAAVDSKLHDTLLSAMLKYADAHVPVTMKTYRPVTFKLIADVKVDPDYIQEKVFAAVEAALRTGFSFAARAFGQPVTLSEVVSAIQNVAGVVAVDVNKLYRSDEREALNALIPAAAPRAGDDTSVAAAELLTLDAAPLELGVMP